MSNPISSWVMAFDRRPLSLIGMGFLGAAAALGVLLCWWVRPYQVQLILGVSVLLWLWALAAAGWRRQWGAGGTATVVIVSMFMAFAAAEKIAAPGAPAAPVCDTWKPEVDLPVIGRPVAALFCYRHGFIRHLADANANIDHDHLLTNYAETLAYLPRALQVGIFAPFPGHWLEDALSPGGRVKRLLSGVEMLFVYGMLVGLFGLRLLRGHEQAIGALVVLAVAGILFYVYTSPNYGALYRYRLPFLLLLMIVASAGWSRWVESRRAVRRA